MTDRKELERLIHRATAYGAVVIVDEGQDRDGRFSIETVRIVGLPGCGPFPMSAIGAAERLRELV